MFPTEMKKTVKSTMKKVNFSRDLDVYSPYLIYIYLKRRESHSYQVIVETNRGCPFL